MGGSGNSDAGAERVCPFDEAGITKLLCNGQHTLGVVPTYPQTDFLKNVRISELLLCVRNKCSKLSQLLMLMQLPGACVGVWQEESSKNVTRVLLV